MRWLQYPEWCQSPGSCGSDWCKKAARWGRADVTAPKAAAAGAGLIPEDSRGFLALFSRLKAVQGVVPKAIKCGSVGGTLSSARGTCWPRSQGFLGSGNSLILTCWFLELPLHPIPAQNTPWDSGKCPSWNGMTQTLLELQIFLWEAPCSSNTLLVVLINPRNGAAFLFVHFHGFFLFLGIFVL